VQQPNRFLINMTNSPRIYVAGRRGIVGSAIFRNLQQRGQTNIVTRSRLNALDWRATVRLEDRLESVYADFLRQKQR